MVPTQVNCSQHAAEWPRWPSFNQEMLQAASRILESGKVNYWTGSEGRSFEDEFAKHIGCKHAIAVANGTLALELALYALDIGPGDEVIVPSRTFIATASSVVMRGATPVCADIDREHQNITVDTVERVLTNRTKAIIPVHLAGWPCDMDPLLELAKDHSLVVIEDCAQAHGARYKSRPVGSMGDMAAYSFCQDKIITTAGEGGMLVTDRDDLWERAWRYKDHGKNPEAFYEPIPASNKFRWLHDSFGTNYRLSEIQSAIGRIALRLLPQWHEARSQNAKRLHACCLECPALRTPLPPREIDHGWYKFYTFVRLQYLKQGWNRNRLLKEMRENGIPCFSGSCSEIYLENAFPEEWRPKSRHRVAHELGETSLMFRVDPALTEECMNSTCDVIRNVLRQATEATSFAA